MAVQFVARRGKREHGTLFYGRGYNRPQPEDENSRPVLSMRARNSAEQRGSVGDLMKQICVRVSNFRRQEGGFGHVVIS